MFNEALHHPVMSRKESGVEAIRKKLLIQPSNRYGIRCLRALCFKIIGALNVSEFLKLSTLECILLDLQHVAIVKFQVLTTPKTIYML